LEFKVGDKVIYPNHGVGVIEKIQSRVLSGEERTFYTLRILSTDSTVMIPVANTGTVGLRKVLSKKDIEDIFGVLRTDKISGVRRLEGSVPGELGSHALRGDRPGRRRPQGLTFLAQTKSLSYRERKMLDRARFLLVSEIAEASRTPMEKVEVQVDEALAVSLKAKTDH
jgi:CarD family transcriptional regulator